MQKLPQTTEELLALLNQERLAWCQGKSHSFTLDPAMQDKFNERFKDDPLALLLGLEGVLLMGAYWDFRELVHAHQVEHQISGLKLTTIRLGDRIFSFHQDCHELKLLPSDLEILKAEKPLLVQAWTEWVKQHQFSIYLVLANDETIFYTLDDVLKFADCCEWASISTRDGVTLRTGWGDPVHALFNADENADDLYFEVVDQATICNEWANGDPDLWMEIVQRQACPIRPGYQEVKA